MKLHFLGVALVWTFLNAATPTLSTLLLGNAVTEITGTVVNVVNETTGSVVDVVNIPAGIFFTEVNGIIAYVVSVLDGVGETVWVMGSDAANVACIHFADYVVNHPIKKPRIENISFILRTPCGSKEFPVSEAGKFRNATEFDVNRTTVVFVTGWLATPDEYYVHDMAKAYHCRGGVNYIIVNTGGYLTNLYINAAALTTILGEFVAVGLQNLGIPAENIHLIGHSMGAHIVGSAARHYFVLTGNKIVRATGLDPARICFITPLVFARLGVGDAIVVDIIHTNPKGHGTEEPIGDIDSFPGGLKTTKPGCLSISLACSHFRAILYYIETIYPNNVYNFIGVHCASYSNLESNNCVGSTNPMGYATDLSAKGIYYLTVKAQSLYGMNATVDATLPSGECGSCPN